MRITLPCDCAEEEHEIDVDPEWSFGHLGWHGPGEGDELPCGRILTSDDTQIIYERITDPGDP